MTWVAAGQAEVRIEVRVQPRSSRNRVAGVQAGRLRLQVTAPPVDGAANTAVLALLADWLSLPRRNIEIVRGDTGRDKLISISSDHPAELAAEIERRAVN